MPFQANSIFQPGFRLTDGSDWIKLFSLLYSSMYAITATGAAQATGYQLTSAINQVSVCGNGAGVVLPKNPVPGQPCSVRNDGQNACTVYGNGTDTVDGAASASVTNAKGTSFQCYAPGKWMSVKGA